MNALASKRLQKELNDWQKKPVPGLSVEPKALDKWVVTISGAKDTLFEGETFRLLLSFPDNYPMSAPEAVFDPATIPNHPHIYSNGHICLNVLYDDGWSPALTVNSVVLSILSMLSSCTEKGRPPDDAMYVKSCNGRSPKQTRWWFHDDGV